MSLHHHVVADRRPVPPHRLRLARQSTTSRPPASAGERITLEGRIVDGDGKPVNDARGRDLAGQRARQVRAPRGRAGQAARARHSAASAACPPTTNGSFRFTTIKPGRVPGPRRALQAPHIVVTIFMRGMLKQLITRMYFPDDPANAEDPVLKLVPPDAARDADREARRRSKEARWSGTSSCRARTRPSSSTTEISHPRCQSLTRRARNACSTRCSRRRRCAAIFSDRGRLQGMLDFEAALARAEASAGVHARGGRDGDRGAVPRRAVRHRCAGASRSARRQSRDPAGARADGARVAASDARGRALRALGRDQPGRDGHRARAAVARRARRRSTPISRGSLRRWPRSRRTHARTPLAGRTWLQQGPPVTLGLKAAGWLSAVERASRARRARACRHRGRSNSAARSARSPRSAIRG